VKGHPFEATVPPGLNVRGAILADHLKNLGWRQRQAQKAGKIPRAILEQVRERRLLEALPPNLTAMVAPATLTSA
jgi:mRNA-degrading endonuclease toxin of MazEF toxin-antitoxin module